MTASTQTPSSASLASRTSGEVGLDAPAFSVVMPTYNRAHLVGRAIRSVLGQTFADFELVIVDDASTDGTDGVIRAFGDARIVYVRRLENGGNARARNDGLRRARGRYITFLDSDDEFLPEFLAEIHRLFAEADEDVGFAWVGRYTVVDSPGPDGDADERITRTATWVPPTSGSRYEAFLRTLQGGIGYGLTIRRACLETVGLFDENLRSAVDTDYVLRLAERYPYACGTRLLVKVHLHEGARVTRSTANKARSYEAIIRKHLPKLAGSPDVQARLHYKVGHLFYQAGDRTAGRRHLAAALRKRPFWPKAWLAVGLYEVFGTRAPRVHYHASRLAKRVRGRKGKKGEKEERRKEREDEGA